ncbi:hypothetical protein CFC21_111585 [Triticum aestivum]|uniref:F-box domain-containing protein n=2 Tax=Triticum aestivum TaxID=4565 RepID=A0A9R1NF89_WHEAT|nr:uncharacterized protein LOC123168164 [Triticum aestivum]KAF7111595.1 hypothetical protein CFC21_111585 [Triticum aestivum]
MEFRRRSARLRAGADRISALPDDLLLLVLARLRCARAAARTGLISRRWRGLAARLREIVFRGVPLHRIEAALGRLSPAVSLLEIRVPKERRADTARGKLLLRVGPARGNSLLRVGTTRANSLLRAAARLEPEELVFDLPSDLIDGSLVVDLPCLRRATFIALRIFLLILRVPDGAEFPALESLSLSCGIAHAHLDALLRHCPRLRTLRLGGFLFDQGDLRVNSASLQELAVDRESGLTHRVDIVAPALKQLSMSLIATEVSISVLAPMVEKVSWHCCYRAGSITFGLWELEQVTLETSESQGQLPSLQIHASIFRSNFPGGAISFTQEIAKHMVVAFSALELHLKTAGHVFGAIVFLLLGMNRIRPAVRRLKLVLWRTTVRERCLPNCPCQPLDWRSQTVSFTHLEEVEITGFEGVGHEFDFLKLMLGCSPALKKMTLKLSRDVWSRKDGCTIINDIFKAYPSVQCYVYLSYGFIHGYQNYH